MEIITKKRMMLFTGTIHPALGHEIADCLSIPVSPAQLFRFASGEIYFRAEESVRGADVFVVQTHYEPVNEALMEQLIMIDAMKRASAKRITAVVPVLRVLAPGPQGAVARTHQREAGRRPAVDRRRRPRDLGGPALGQIQGYFDCPFDHLTALPILSNHFKDTLGLHGDDLVVVAPDAGRIKTSEKLREYLHADLAFLYKRRSRHEAHKIEEMAVVGEVEGRPCVIVDDMIDTASTISKGVHALAEMGAGPIYVGATHGHLQRQGPSVARRGADRAGRRDEHGADPRRAQLRQAEGALDRPADRERPACRVRRLQRQRDLRRRQPGLV